MLVNQILVDQTQACLKNIWAELLDIDIDIINPESCYFSLGGTSLNAFMLINKVSSELDKDISISLLMENSVLKTLSEEIALL